MSRDLEVLKALLDAHPEAAKEKHPTEAAAHRIYFKRSEGLQDFQNLD